MGTPTLVGIASALQRLNAYVVRRVISLATVVLYSLL